MPDGKLRIACASSGQLVLPGGSDRNVLLETGEYETLKSSGGREYSFSMPGGQPLLVLDLSRPDEALGAKAPRRTDAPAPDAAPPEGFAFMPMRALLGSLPADSFRAVLRATHLVQWRRRTRFCPHCASPLRESSVETALECPACSLVEYPRISPAVIVLVERKGRIALARNSSFSGGMHSLIAGFVEAGESMEETISREVLEEIGVPVDDIRYFGSQSWPFPDSMMVGFRAQGLSAELKPDGVEIVEAAWFGPDNLPPIPRKGSIARSLIDAWLAERGFRTDGK